MRRRAVEFRPMGPGGARAQPECVGSASAYVDMLSSGRSDCQTGWRWWRRAILTRRGRGRGAGEAESNCNASRADPCLRAFRNGSSAKRASARQPKVCFCDFCDAGSGSLAQARDVHVVCIIIPSSVTLGSMARKGDCNAPRLLRPNIFDFLHSPLFNFRVQLKPHLDDPTKMLTRDRAQSRRGC